MISSVHLHLLALFTLLVMLLNNHQILAFGIGRAGNHRPHLSLVLNDQPRSQEERDAPSRETSDDEVPSSDLWSVIFRPGNIPAVPGFNFQRGVAPMNGFKKRKIPLELQKALYAHGIVGRRRR